MKFARLLRTPILKRSASDYFWRCFIKKLFLKTSMTKVASGMGYVKKVFLVVDRAVKVTCFYNDQYFL